MKDLETLFWQASIDEVKRGYVYSSDTEEYRCLRCGKGFTKGVIYPDQNRWLDAEKAVREHLSQEHSSMFEYLLGLDKKITGLTEHQKQLLTYFYQGLSDQHIAKELGGGSTSTIRNHRFALKQREKQAKVFFTIMELLEENKMASKEQFVPVYNSATMVDERFALTVEEYQEIIRRYFKEGEAGPLATFPTKEKRKIAVLRHLIQRFELGKKYSEKEVNEILKQAYPDFVTLRRYFIEYGFMDREDDGSVYWVKK